MDLAVVLPVPSAPSADYPGWFGAALAVGVGVVAVLIGGVLAWDRLSARRRARQAPGGASRFP